MRLPLEKKYIDYLSSIGVCSDQLLTPIADDIFPDIEAKYGPSAVST